MADDDQDGADAVPERRALRAAEDLHERLGVGRRVLAADDGRVPERPGAAQRPAGDPEEDHAGQHEPVLDALVDVEADDAPHRIDAGPWPCRLEPLAQLVDEVDEDVEGEEEQRQRREPRERDVDDVRDRVPARLLRRLVRDERREVVVRALVAARAGVLAVRDVDDTRGRSSRRSRACRPCPAGPRGSSRTPARRRVLRGRAGRGSSRGRRSSPRVEAGRLRELLVPVARLAPPRHLAAVLRDRLPCLPSRIVEGERLHRVRRAVAGGAGGTGHSCPRAATCVDDAANASVCSVWQLWHARGSARRGDLDLLVALDPEPSSSRATSCCSASESGGSVPPIACSSV